ncbi:hypothetical protein HBB16_20240 [Pseudonocardia sp. MCCB 268]|nr:hypothetical protein [Pseudonocardia cytotoxica]
MTIGAGQRARRHELACARAPPRRGAARRAGADRTKIGCGSVTAGVHRPSRRTSRARLLCHRRGLLVTLGDQ